MHTHRIAQFDRNAFPGGMPRGHTEEYTGPWHAPERTDPAFQQQALELMRAAARAGQADRIELAYLTDRVAVNTGRLQIYGTQITCVDGDIAPAPLVDPEHVDERRAAVGLGPLQEYLDSFPDDICAGQPTPLAGRPVTDPSSSARWSTSSAGSDGIPRPSAEAR